MRISDWSSDVCSSDLLGKSLKIAVHPPLARRDRKRIIGTREMVEADRNIAGVGQASIAEFGLLEAQPLVRQPARVDPPLARDHLRRSDEHTSELQSLMRISYAVFSLKKKN